jgi:SecA DEAD-like domain
MRSLVSKLMGTGSERHHAELRKIVARVNELEAHYQGLSDEEIRAEMAEVRAEVREAAAYREADEEETSAAHGRRRTTAGSRWPWTASCRMSSLPLARSPAGSAGCATTTSS